jgi:hypothetical protein
MPRDALIALTGRARMGGALRSGAAIVFPSLAVLDDNLPAVGILLYLLEVIASALLLYGRTGMSRLFARRAFAASGATVPSASASLKQAGEHASMVIGIGLICAPFLWIAALIGSPGQEWPQLLDLVVERGRWLVLCILVSGVLDTLLAPVRSPEWLREAARTQLQRVWLLHPVILFGFLLYAATGSLLGMVVLFVGGRLLMDLTAWRTSARHGAAQFRGAWARRTE